jgi:hypothetical protein
MDKKLSDDEVVKQFRGRSLSQKLGIFKRVLAIGQSHQSFILLVKTWIEDTVGDDRGRPRQGRQSSCLTSFRWDDDEDGLSKCGYSDGLIHKLCAILSIGIEIVTLQTEM